MRHQSHTTSRNVLLWLLLSVALPIATTAPAATQFVCENFNSGFTGLATIGAHDHWFDGGTGPVATAGTGVGGSVGLDPAGAIFTWTAHPFNWNASDFVGINFQMDFQTNASGQFDDDRVGWMTRNDTNDSNYFFGVQLDPGGTGQNIEAYWDGTTNDGGRTSIVSLPALTANAWYRLRAEITKLTATSAKIDVSLRTLDGSGNPGSVVASGSIPDTAALGSTAPDQKPLETYFTAATMWPAFKNHSGTAGKADNACFEILSGAPAAPPTALSANAVLHSKIELGWTDNSDNETGFVIERAQGSGGAFSYLATAPANSTTYNDTNVVADSEYCYRVRAVNALGNSDYTGVACDTTPAKPAYAALDFDGTNSYVTFGDASALRLGQFTLECWFKREGTGVATSTGTGGLEGTNVAVPLVTKGRGEADGSNLDMNYFFGIRSNGNVIAADFEDTDSYPNNNNHPIAGITSIQNGIWYHAAATYDGTTWRLYLNGNLENVLPVNKTPRSDSIQHAGIATAMTSNGTAAGYFNGIIDEVRIWNYARTQDQIIETINSRIETVQTGLVGRWSLDEGEGTVVNGSAGTTVNGTIVGSAYSWAYPGSPFNLDVNRAPNQPTLVAPTDDAVQVGQSPSLSVTVTDPDSDAMTVAYYGRALNGAAGESFTLVVLPDTQFYSESYPATFNAQTQWIVNNKTTRNIVYVAHEGDIVNVVANETQWSNADAAMDILDAAGIPYGVVPGNHDEGTLYDQTFGVNRFCTNYPSDCRSFYGGSYPSGSNQNSYTLFRAGGMDFIVINLDYTNPAAGYLDWADALLQTHSTRRAIVVTHDLIGTGNPASFSTAGGAVWNALKDRPNLFLMLGGHTAGEGRRTDTGDSGNTVYSLLADYQSRANGGDGWLRILEFVPSTNEIRVKTYSPTRLSGAGEFEIDADSQFTLPYNMEKPAFELIGSQSQVASGAQASFNWNGLEIDNGYEWHVTVSDGEKTTTGPIWSFTTTNDSDGDGIPDSIELASGCMDPNDADTDDDGILDGNEDLNRNGIREPNETNPCSADTDGDGVFDGTEIGLTAPQGSGTNLAAGKFVADTDPTTTTNPLLSDTDYDGLPDGEEDANRNGRVDIGENDPLAYAACPPRLTAYYRLNETVAPYEDEVAVSSAICVNCPSPVAGIVDGAQQFDGVDDGIDTPENNRFDWDADESFAIEFWMNTNAANSVIVGRDGTPMKWWVGLNASGQAAFQLYDSTGSGNTTNGTVALNNGEWHHVVAVRDNSVNENRLYVDGVLAAVPSAFDYTGAFAAAAPVNIGHFNSSSRYAGIVDEVAIYVRALTAAEIQKHYQNGLAQKGCCDVGPAFTSLGLKQSIDKSAWKDVVGSLASGFSMEVAPAVEFHYLDVSNDPGDTATDRPIIPGSYGFNLVAYPVGFFDYWASRGVSAGSAPGSWQAHMYQIITGAKPMFYLKVSAGPTYMLVDGLQKDYLPIGIEDYLRVDGGYPLGAYQFLGTVEDAFAVEGSVTVGMTFELGPVPDIDGDGDVDGTDLYLFILAYGNPVLDPRCDFDLNGVVNEIDLENFAAEFAE